MPAAPAQTMTAKTRRTANDLSAQQRLLLQVMHDNQFGRIENIPVQDGQPHLDPEMRVVRVARLGGSSGGERIPASPDFELKQVVCDLLDELTRLENGTIVKLEFKRGLPCLLETTLVTGI